MTLPYTYPKHRRLRATVASCLKTANDLLAADALSPADRKAATAARRLCLDALRDGKPETLRAAPLRFNEIAGHLIGRQLNQPVALRDGLFPAATSLPVRDGATRSSAGHTIDETPAPSRGSLFDARKPGRAQPPAPVLLHEFHE